MEAVEQERGEVESLSPKDGERFSRRKERKREYAGKKGERVCSCSGREGEREEGIARFIE
eukprot:scaffold143584_cov15-Tisochrysis_lutea.AAC.1